MLHWQEGRYTLFQVKVLSATPCSLTSYGSVWEAGDGREPVCVHVHVCVDSDCVGGAAWRRIMLACVSCEQSSIPVCSLSALCVCVCKCVLCVCVFVQPPGAAEFVECSRMSVLD